MGKRTKSNKMRRRGGGGDRRERERDTTTKHYKAKHTHIHTFGACFCAAFTVGVIIGVAGVAEREVGVAVVERGV